MNTFPTRTLGRNGPRVSTLGLGLMGMSAFYGPAMPDKDAFPLLDRAIELGCTFWDTSNVYGANEETLNRYFKSRPQARAKVFLATKFGIVQDGNDFAARGDADYVTQSANTALKRIGIDYIDLFYIHRIDKKVPIEVTMKALAQLKNEGKIRHIGISEATADTIRRAHAVHPLVANQIEYSPFELTAERTGILKTCRELGIATVAYSPLGRGLLTGKIRSTDDFAEDDFRRTVPRFSKENFPKNLAIVDEFAQIAQAHKATAGQLALAWLLAQGEDVFPIPGTTRIENLEENLGAASVKLNAAEIESLNRVVRAADVSGDRYSGSMHAMSLGETPELK